MENISPHLPKEVRQQGKGDTAQQLWVLKTVGLAALFGFFSGLVGALVITTHLVDDWLYGRSAEGAAKNFSIYPSGRPLSRDDLVKKAQNSLVSIYRGRDIVARELPPPEVKLGAGFFLTNDGWLATTAAAIEKLTAKELKVVTADKETLPVEKLVSDSASDIIFLKVAKNERAALPFAYKDTFEAGSQLLAASTDLGIKSSEVLLTNFLPPRKRGEISFSSDRIYRFGLLAGRLSKFSLGAPLLNNQGEVVGLAVKSAPADLPATLFLPASLIRSALSGLLASDERVIKRPALGVNFAESSASSAGERGVILKDDLIRHRLAVEKWSPLPGLGLKAGDKIISVNNEAITDLRTLPEIILDYAPDSKIDITVEKEGRVLTESVVLGAR